MKRSAREIEESHAKVTRRALVLGGLQVGFLGILGARMHHLQVREADQFRLLAEENRINIRLVPPERGLIYDREGRLIAGNVQNYGITIVREDAGDVDAVVDRLRKLVRLDENQLARGLREVERRSSFVPILLADGLTWEEFAAVAVNAPALPGITPEVGQSRIYPLGADFAHSVGYIGRVTERDLENDEDDDPLLQLPQFQIGKFGTEGKLDRLLRGSAGTRRIEVNAVGRVMRELNREEGEAGANVQLTIDAALQNFVAARLGEESAAAVVIDLEQGDVVAAASSPSYDPNLFIGGISQAEFDLLRLNDHRPLHNKIVQGLYPPGSTFKMVTLLAALENGAIDADETIRCAGHLEVSGRKFHCWRRGGHGATNARKSLIESCDTYYYDICQRIGIEKIASMARRLGLGQAYDLPMTSVSSGLIPDRDWKFRVRKEEWRIGDTLNASIGQGYVLSSPMQLAVMTAKLATGHEMAPRMVRAIDGVETPSGKGAPLGLNPEHLRLVREAMYAVNNTGRGTAFSSRILTDGQKWAGKTGTSQVRNITEAERARGVTRNEDLPWERRDHALYVGYAPFEAPKYAISVVVEHGGGGSTAAAPVARDIMLAALNGGSPPLSAFPSGQRRAAEDRLEALPLREIPEPEEGRGQA